MATDYSKLPDDLPAPIDDGAADHLTGVVLPSLPLTSTPGGEYDLGATRDGRVVVYIYPRTGVPGRESPTGWDQIPGARGCTPQSCAFRDHVSELAARGATVVGLSAQPPAEQFEFSEREQIPYPLLADPELRLAAALGLPTFEVDDLHLYKRLTFVAEQGTIVKVFYPVFPPDRNAAVVLDWLESTAG